MEEVELDEEGAETRGCRSHWVGAAVGQSNGEIARFAHGANYIGHQFRGIGVRHRFMSRGIGANSATFAATDLANERCGVVMGPDFGLLRRLDGGACISAAEHGGLAQAKGGLGHLDDGPRIFRR
jgi:hypothetical protein